MLSKETKKKIDDARDILVGQLPLPSDQVELITIALIYKFMDDQDEDLRQLGFEEAFFSGDLKQYSWQRLMSNEIDAEERVNIFIKGIEEIQKATHIPLLFREIFKNTFLKFRDGRTLHLFLGVINGFSYDHSEELGNAFEYLLMSMGAQGENGQFRTPRNIIDFIVEVVDPDKGHTILDPACGTGGFLLSAYKHILRKYTTDREHYRITLSNEEIEGIPVNWGNKLDSQDRKKLGDSIEGYDITPQMTRLARVNLYLHQFPNPRIHEYDTLTSDGRWRDKYDCILANPPFMTPKGGVSTHSRFRIRATKAEVLFSDYILEHLTPDGMAGFIVPEGIIFQNSGDYVELRNWLINGAGLWAVVSLPAQIFQPYSGVKTSILFIDRKIARGRDEIILVKVENDGYSLNTNRAPTARNDLPEALNLLTIGKKSLEELRGYLEQNSGKQDMPHAMIKPRKELERLDAYKAQSAAFNLIRKQYEKCRALVEEIKLPPPADQKGLGEKDKKTRTRLQGNLTKQATEFSKITGIAYTKILPPLQSYFDDNLKEAVIAYGADRTKFGGLSTHLRDYLDGQREYNLSFDKYAGGETQEKSSGFEMVTLGDTKYFRIESGGTPKSERPEFWNGAVDWVTLVDLPAGNFITEIVTTKRTITETGLKSSSAKLLPPDSILVSSRATIGRIGINRVELATNQGFKNIVINDKNSIDTKYVAYIITALVPEMEQLGSGATYKEISKQQFSTLQIPLPPLEIQKQIVAEIEAYQKVVDGCNLIIENYKPGFAVDESWKRMKLGELAGFKYGYTETGLDEGLYRYIRITDIDDFNLLSKDNPKYVNQADGIEDYLVIKDDLLIARTGATFGKCLIINEDINAVYASYLIKVSVDSTTLLPNFFWLFCQSSNYWNQANLLASGAGQPQFNANALKQIVIPIPPLETQQKIVAELEEDLAAVAGAKRLKAKMEVNIRATIGRVWGK